MMALDAVLFWYLTNDFSMMNTLISLITSHKVK